MREIILNGRRLAYRDEPVEVLIVNGHRFAVFADYIDSTLTVAADAPLAVVLQGIAELSAGRATRVDEDETQRDRRA